MERFEILARLDEINWLLSNVTDPTMRAKLEARKAELGEMLSGSISTTKLVEE